jgi:predicted ester cyclase
MAVTTEQIEANKKLARDYIDQVFNQHNPAKAADFVSGDVVWHGGGLGDIAGPDNLAGLLESFIGALPDLYAAEQDIIAENDLVLVRLVVTATVRGSLLGCRPTASRSGGTRTTSTGSPTARSARSGPATTSRRS